MIDPSFETIIDGKSVKLSELVEMYRNLRWRRWPEEKPTYAEQILTYGFGYPAFQANDRQGIEHLESLNGRTFEVYWLPLSALPKPEGEK